MNWKWECDNKECGKEIKSYAYVKDIYAFCSRECMDNHYKPKLLNDILKNGIYEENGIKILKKVNIKPTKKKTAVYNKTIKKIVK